MVKRSSLIIRGGLIYDGSGAEPFMGDIGVTDDLITFVGDSCPFEVDREIDGRTLAVTPGFIDSHAHSDFTLFADPRAEGKICQGVTTEINGNCGMSAAPLIDRARERREDDLRELGISERWTTLAEYFALLEQRRIALNTAVLAGHGNLRGSVVGYDDRSPTADETLRMRDLLRGAIEDGAIGLSTGLIYPPGIYSRTDELVFLGKELAAYDRIYASHMRSEGDGLIEAVEEVMRIGREGGCKVHISHLKTAGQRNWQKAESVMRLIEGARGAGVRLTCDRYPYIASSTDLDAILPAWAYAGGNDEELRRLGDPVERERMAAEIRLQSATGDYWDRVTVSSVASDEGRWMEGKSLASIARELHQPPIEALFSILLRERLRVGAIFGSMCEDNLRAFLSLPFCMIGSDSSARSFDGPTRTGKPHPRTFGTFPRILGRYVREEGVLTLREAICRMTSLPAETFRLRGRGLLREGMFADIVVFDPAAVIDRATYEEPYQRPEGIRHVLVNGRIAVSDGKPTGERGGRVLRGG